MFCRQDRTVVAFMFIVLGINRANYENAMELKYNDFETISNFKKIFNGIEDYENPLSSFYIITIFFFIVVSCYVVIFSVSLNIDNHINIQ